MQTPLINILTPLKVDTLLICGGATSGCVRASVVDAASYGFTVGVIEECTFDRGEVSHKVNLFDMNSKYASVVSSAEIKEYLGKVVQ
jgi:nicotinamidase-related amidase